MYKIKFKKKFSLKKVLVKIKNRIKPLVGRIVFFPRNTYKNYNESKFSDIHKRYAECLSFFKPNKTEKKANGILLVQMIEDYEFTIKMAAVSKVIADKHHLNIGFYGVLIHWIWGKHIEKTKSQKRLDARLIKILSPFANKLLFDNNERYKDQALIQQKLNEIKSKLDINNGASVLDIKFDGILVGDLIYDTYLRFFHQPTIEKINDDVIHIIEVALNVFYNFNLFIKSNPVKVLVNSYSSYIHHGIPARICLYNNIEVYTVGSYSYIINKLSKDFPYHQINHTLFSPDKNLSDQQLDLAKQIFTSRFEGIIDPATSYMKQSAFSDKPLNPEVKKLFSKEPRNIVIYAHDFYDSPHVNRMLQFPDLYQFLKQTLQALIDLKGTTVFIKTHPNGIAGCKEKTIDLVNSFHKSHFHILDESVSNLHIIDLKPDLIATARGTVCVEMAYFEIPTVALYDNLYANFDFVHTCKTTESYFSILKGEEKPIINFDKKNIYSFYYQAYIEQFPNDAIFELLSTFKGNTYNDDYLQLIISHKHDIFSERFLNYYHQANLN